MGSKGLVFTVFCQPEKAVRSVELSGVEIRGRSVGTNMADD